LACLQQPTAAVAEAARIISNDPGMTANVMKLVNSAFFGSRQPIGTVSRAIDYLGLDTLGALVLGHSAIKSGMPAGVDGFSLARLWQHSLETAIAARTVARSEKLSAAQADEAFVAGMLHDFGKVMWATVSTTAGDPARAAAAAQMEAHHAEVGAALLGSWGFPTSIVQAAAFHHAPAQAACGAGLCPPALIHIANRLVQQRRTECSGPFERDLEPELLAKLGLADRWTGWLAALDSLDFLESAA
jgi:putative nucleotidyltransferase with HDIG domain